MLESQRGGYAATRSAVEKTDLDQEGLVDLFNRIDLFAQVKPPGYSLPRDRPRISQ